MRISAGVGSGLIGVVIFSGTLPATRIAVTAMSPLFVTGGRAVVAALLGAVLLACGRQQRPAREDLPSLVIVAAGVVIGFPLLAGLALRFIGAAQSVVFVGLLPLATAVFAVVRGGERPRAPFWLLSGVGAVTIIAFALDRRSSSMAGDGLLIAAVILCGLGYSEGAMLARKLGGWQVISWALLAALPVMTAVTLISMPPNLMDIGWAAWMGFAYVSVFSMMVGFIFWYRGLALGGTAKVGQLQLLQPFFGLILAAITLHEPIGWPMIASASIIILCVAGARRFG